MSDEEIVPKRATVDKVNIAYLEKWHTFTGDCDIVNKYLEGRPNTSIWGLFHYLNSLTRSFGQVVLANNPISGVLIMLGVGIADVRALLAACAAASLSFLAALLLRQDCNAVYNGIFGYSPVLHGIISVSLLPTLYPQISITEPRFWLFLFLATILSIYVTSGLMNMCRHLGQYPIPCFTLPFNVIQYPLIFCILQNAVPENIFSDELVYAPGSDVPAFSVEVLGPQEMDITSDAFNTTHARLDWGKVFAGSIVSLSQVYGLNHVLCSLLMFLGLVIYSPTTAGCAYLGGMLATILGQVFARHPQEIYDGLWGYNSLLTVAALAGFSFVLTLHSAILAFFALLFVLVLQHVLTPLSLTLGVPVLTLPFNITAILFNLVTSEGNTLVRPIVFSSPEKHRQQMLHRTQEGRSTCKSLANEKWSESGEV